MSTNFIIARDKDSGIAVSTMDSDCIDLLFKDLIAWTGPGRRFDPNDFTFTLLDYKLDVIDKDWDWSNTSVNLATLFGKKTRR